MAVPVEIRKMEREDVPEVMRIELECFPTPWHESAYLTEIANRSAYYVVACIDSRVVGYAGMWVIVDEAHITTLGVSKEMRGLKIGEQLLIALIDESLRRSAKRATLEVRQSNIVAQNLYRKYGFAPVAIRRGYYTDNQENAIVMWAEKIHAAAYQEKYQELKRAVLAEVQAQSVGGVV